MSSIINNETYALWTKEWRELENQEKPFQFFLRDDKLLLGDFLDPLHLELLFSTIGISTVKVRLGFDAASREFKLILFGTDSSGEQLTPYYAHTPDNFREIGDGGPHGNVPGVLAKKWKNYWLNHGYAGRIGRDQFFTPYGFLNGYNYPLKELISSLFNYNRLPRIYLHFVLHRYYSDSSGQSSSEPKSVYTFGLLFQAVGRKGSAAGQAVAGDDDGDGGYYDLSAPCPRTC